MRRILSLVERIAPHDTTVLIEGETGTGKTLVAEAIHDCSCRKDGPFVVVDCGGVSPTLIESELFGHVRGAFTSAHRDHVGVLESADGGTVFLDEIGELPLELQPKLLRALEQRAIRPVGDVAERTLDVRVVAATNRDLRAEVSRGAFRSDLYYRLNTVAIRIPPLRERPEDVALLVSHFCRALADDGESVPPGLLADFMRRSWPGNVRELRSAVERAVLLGETDVETATNAATSPPRGTAAVAPGTPYRAAKERVVAAFDRAYFTALMERHRGNVSRAAREAGIDRNYLRDLLRRRSIPIRRNA
jgi:DNA-binding NtrC family response regulator